MATRLDTALDHYSDRQSLVKLTSRAVGDLWSEVDPRNIVQSWAALIPETAAVVSGAQLAAARPASRYVDDVLEEEGVSTEGVGEVNPAGFAGQASDARGLIGPLTNPVFVTLSSIADGLDVVRALFHGRQNLDMLATTQVADAGRLADQVGITSRKNATGYVRLAVGNSCARCLILAGQFYKWNAGFKRHERCDCVHVPSGSEKARLMAHPEDIYARMNRAERLRAGFTVADQKAIRDGADLNQIVNARHRPDSLRTAGSRRGPTTTEGTTKRGLAHKFKVDPETGKLVRRAKDAVPEPRLSVDEIYRIAGDDRDLAVALLGEHTYLRIGEVHTVSPARRLEIRRQAEAFIDGNLSLDDILPLPNSASGAAATGAVTAVTIRPELARAKSLRAVEFEFSTEFYAITGRRLKDVDFTGSALETAKEHAEGILRGVERFPEANLKTVFTMATPNDGRYAEASHGYIAFSDKWAGNRKRYLAALDGDAASGFHPPNSANPMAIAIHEFGHTLDLHTLGDTIAADVEALIARAAAETGVAADRLIAMTVSEYAAKNTHELVAEAFADVMINGENASRISRGIFDLLEAEYKRPGSSRAGAFIVAKPSAPRTVKARQGSTIGDVELGPTQLDVALGEAPTVKRPKGEFADREYSGPRGVITARGERLPDGFDSDLEAIRRGEFELRPGLTLEESQALDRYALSRVADPLNTGLRQGKTSGFGTARIADQVVDLDDELRLLDSAIDAGALAEDTVLYRGAIMRPADVGKLQVGAVTSESGFLSTTTSMENAFSIIDWRQASAPAGRSRVVFEILAPKGTRAGAGHTGELEVLLGRGRRMRVVEVTRPTRAGGSRRVVLELLPDVPPPAVAAVAEDLSKLTVPKLRALAKERGITVPTGAKKADIVRLLDEPARKPGRLSMTEVSVDKAQAIVDDLEAMVRRQVAEGGSVKATTARVRTQLRAIRLQPIDAAGNDLVNTSAARAVRYEWRQPGRTIRLDEAPPAGLSPIELREFGEAARLSRMALAVEDAQAAGADVVAALRAARAAAPAVDRTAIKAANRFPLAEGLRGPTAAKRQRERDEVLTIIRDSGARGRGLQGDLLEQAQALKGAGLLRYDQRLGNFTLTDEGREYLAVRDGAKAGDAAFDRAAQKAAARARQAERDLATSRADAIAGLDELLAKSPTPATVKAELDVLAQLKTLTPADITALRRVVATGDPAKIAATVDRISAKYNLTGVARAGDITTMREGFDTLGGRDVPAGAPVKVIRRGTEILQDGKAVVLSRPVVRALDEAELAKIRQAAIDEAKAVVSGAKPTAAQLKKAGITKVGTVSKTKTVAFDPKVYDVQGGGTVAAGAKVRVVEPGYSVEYRGETVVLRKPVVEAVAAPKPKNAFVPINRDVVVPDPNRLVAGSDIVDPGLPADIVAQSAGFAFSRDPGLAAIASRQGFDGLPSVVTREQLEMLYEAGAPRMLRGFQATAEKTAREMVEDMRSGRYFAGRGVYGNGYYFAPPNNRAGGVFTRAENFARDKDDALVRATLHPGVRLVDYNEIRDAYEAYWRSLGVDPAVGISAYGRGPEDIALSDLGRFAAARGYDVIWDGWTRQWIVLNRTALIIEDVP